MIIKKKKSSEKEIFPSDQSAHLVTHAIKKKNRKEWASLLPEKVVLCSNSKKKFLAISPTAEGILY